MIKKILGIFIIIGFTTVCFAEETIKIATEKWEPYTSESLKHHGIAARIVTDAFALEGVRVIYGFSPWLRGFKMTKTGEWDGTFPYYFKNERTEHFLYSDPLFDGVVVFFHLKNRSFDWKTYDYLKTKIM